VLSDGNHHQTESNAILLSLAKKTGWGLPDDPHTRDKLLALLFYQASTQGPHFGQIEYWFGLAPDANPPALARHRAIINQTISYLDGQLGGNPFFCGADYTIAHIALFPWLHIHDRLGLSLDEAEHLTGWLDRVRKRPATQKVIGFFGPNAMF
jgi:GST-like protein